MAGEIIPFGKYKGQDIDVVRERLVKLQRGSHG
jgi:hypothetical protein